MKKIDLKTVPKPTNISKKEWLTKKGWISGKKKKVTTEEMKDKGNICLYIDKQFRARTYRNVEPGLIRLANVNGKRNEYENEILSGRKIEWEYGGETIPLFIVYEKERYNFPNEPLIDAKEVYKIIKNISINHRNLDEATKGGRFKLDMKDVKIWLTFLGGFLAVIIGAWYLGNIFGFWEFLKGSQPVVETVVETVVNNATTMVVK